MMYDTPEKAYPNKLTSLRERIESKLQTDKKILQTKTNIFKHFQSHTKQSQHQVLCHDPMNNPIHTLSNNPQKEKEQFQSCSTNKKVPNQPLISESNVLQFQSLQNRNFYGFQEWIQFNKKFFPHVQPQVVRNFWKVMRIINYGDIWIPSGLIYEVSKVLAPVRIAEKASLKHTFNQFLKYNNSNDQVNNFRDLKSYPSFDETENAYLKVSQDGKDQSLKKTKQYSSLKKLSEKDDVFQRGYNESRLRNSRKKKMIYQNLIEKQNDEKCFFQPKINKYCPQKLFVENTAKAHRSCQNHDQWMIEALEQQDFASNSTFKAKPFPRNKFESRTLDQIPGAVEYIERRRQTQSQKRKLERYKQRRSSVCRHYN